MDTKTALLSAALVFTGLMAGLWYAWTVSVIPGTKRVEDVTYIETMQHINRAIINPAFIIPFMGIPVLLGVAAWAQFRAGDTRRGWLIVGAAGTYVVGVLGVTVGGNVPLNDSLDAFDLAGSSPADIADRRSSYEGPWNRWHYVRTLGNLVSFAFVSAAALVAADAD